MHARNSSWLIVLTSHSRLMGRPCVVLLLVFWAGVLLLGRFPASALGLFCSSWICGDRRGLSVRTFGLGGFSGSFVCPFHIPLSRNTNSVVSCVSVGVDTLGEMALYPGTLGVGALSVCTLGCFSEVIGWYYRPNIHTQDSWHSHPII